MDTLFNKVAKGLDWMIKFKLKKLKNGFLQLRREKLMMKCYIV